MPKRLCKPLIVIAAIAGAAIALWLLSSPIPPTQTVDAEQLRRDPQAYVGQRVCLRGQLDLDFDAQEGRIVGTKVDGIRCEGYTMSPHRLYGDRITVVGTVDRSTDGLPILRNCR